MVTELARGTAGNGVRGDEPHVGSSPAPSAVMKLINRIPYPVIKGLLWCLERIGWLGPPYEKD